jgi:hypothetical protein
MPRRPKRFSGLGMFLGFVILTVAALSGDFRLLGGGAVYLVLASIFSLLLFSPLRIDRAGPGIGLAPEQLNVVAALAIGFTVLGAMAPFCHGASFHFARAVPLSLTVIFLVSLFPLIIRAEELTTPGHNSHGGYFTKALPSRLVFWAVGAIAEILYLLFSMEAGRRQISVIEVANVGVAVLMIVALTTLRLTVRAPRINSAGKPLFIGWCVLAAVTASMVVFAELTTLRGVRFACLSLVTAIALTASGLSLWPATQ